MYPTLRYRLQGLQLEGTVEEVVLELIDLTDIHARQVPLFDDETELVNVIVRPPLWDKHRAVIRGNPFQLIAGRLQFREDNVNIIASDIRAIERSGKTGP
jgi:hypothetical protein